MKELKMICICDTISYNEIEQSKKSVFELANSKVQKKVKDEKIKETEIVSSSINLTNNSTCECWNVFFSISYNPNSVDN
ncbi:MAG: hypothetical protein IJB90_00195 [Clostridia bacterium]|nr:hypothetical protein [Clostridia bacterium]